MVLSSGIVIGMTPRNNRILSSVEDKAILHLMHLTALIALILSLMVWWETRFNGQSGLKFSIEKKSTKYQEALEQYLFPFGDILGVLMGDFSMKMLQSTTDI